MTEFEKAREENVKDHFSNYWKIDQDHIEELERQFILGANWAYLWCQENQVKKLKEALEFYSDETEDGLDWNGVNNPAFIQDKGKTARQALKELGE